jgi:protein gp37
MPKETKQFWDKGIQLIDGCSKASPGCRNCWSEAMTARFKRVPELLRDGRFTGEVRFNLHLLEKAVKRKEPTVFAIWNDLWHPNICNMERAKAYRLMENAMQHTFLVITKRPQGIADLLRRYLDWGDVYCPQFIWHIVTCENQAMADKRIPHLLRIPGKRGIIVEPCLDEILFYPVQLKRIHQIILGPENGPGKRPFDPAWAESARKQCKAAGVPYYRKDKAQGILAWRPSH